MPGCKLETFGAVSNALGAEGVSKGIPAGGTNSMRGVDYGKLVIADYDTYRPGRSPL